jgi:hypothetical protein
MFLVQTGSIEGVFLHCHNCNEPLFLVIAHLMGSISTRMQSMTETREEAIDIVWTERINETNRITNREGRNLGARISVLTFTHRISIEVTRPFFSFLNESQLSVRTALPTDKNKFIDNRLIDEYRWYPLDQILNQIVNVRVPFSFGEYRGLIRVRSDIINAYKKILTPVSTLTMLAFSSFTSTFSSFTSVNQYLLSLRYVQLRRTPENWNQITNIIIIILIINERLNFKVNKVGYGLDLFPEWLNQTVSNNSILFSYVLSRDECVIGVMDRNYNYNCICICNYDGISDGCRLRWYEAPTKRRCWPTWLTSLMDHPPSFGNNVSRRQCAVLKVLEAFLAWQQTGKKHLELVEQAKLAELE